MKRTILQIVLFIIIVGLAWLVYDSIMQPVRFNKEKNRREKVVVQYLKDIRSAELLYKQLNGRYTGSFDTLIHFMDSAQIPVVKMIPDPTDTTFTRTINDTLGYVRVADSLFGNPPRMNYHKLDIIPFSNNQKFELHAGVIEKGGVKVNVFEAKAPYDAYLYGMDEQTIINMKAAKKDINRYPGLKVGSMTEASTDGNWE
jgi:hypothetical protein